MKNSKKNSKKSSKKIPNKIPLIIPFSELIIVKYKKVFYGRNVKDGITNMRRAGVHDLVIMPAMGHTTREMSDRYDTVEEFEVVDGVKAMAKALKAGRKKKQNG